MRAVESVDLAIADGEFVVLVGPSGCGKSTTLRMIAGLEELSGGTISIGDRAVNDVPPKDRDIAMVFQNYALYPHLTVRQNLAFGLQQRRAYKSRWKSLWNGTYRAQRRGEAASLRDRVESAAVTLGIETLLERQPRELSGGQRQRVAVGRALVRNPAVFLFDEPLSNLDASLRGQMRTELRILHRTLNATMVYVTHDQEEAMSLADRIVVMRSGVVQQIGSPAEIYDRPINRFVASFIGTPPMNMIDGELIRDGRGALSFRCSHFALPLSPARWDADAIGPLASPAYTLAVTLPVKLGIRPDRLKLVAGGSVVEGRSEHHLSGQVVAIERIGSLADVVVRLPSERLVTARCGMDQLTSIREGDSCGLQLDASAAHLFTSDGNAISQSKR